MDNTRIHLGSSGMGYMHVQRYTAHLSVLAIEALIFDCHGLVLGFGAAIYRAYRATRHVNMKHDRSGVNLTAPLRPCPVQAFGVTINIHIRPLPLQVPGSEPPTYRTAIRVHVSVRCCQIIAHDSI